MKTIARRRAEMVNQITHEELDDALSGKLNEEDLKSTPEGVFENAEKNRSLTIGAALAGTVVSWAALEACRQNDNGRHEAYKTWRVTSGNPRPTHALMNGETVPYEEPFSNGAQWPGDIDALSVEEIAGCRCVLEIEVR